MTRQHHFITGGQRSGKSRHAERLAMKWLAEVPGRSVTVVATAQASDDEMQQRIERHRQDRPAAFKTHEEPLHLGAAVRALSEADRLLLVDCLTLWWTQVVFKGRGSKSEDHAAAAMTDNDAADAFREDLLAALTEAPGPVILISNEIGSGVIPTGAEVRAFVDDMGRLNQAVAQRCGVITWMVAGQAFTQAVEQTS